MCRGLEKYGPFPSGAKFARNREGSKEWTQPAWKRGWEETQKGFHELILFLKNRSEMLARRGVIKGEVRQVIS